MRHFRKPLTAIAFGFALLVGFNNCERANFTSPSSEESASKSFETVVGNPFQGRNAKTILEAVCAKISSCRGVVPLECQKAVMATSGIDTVLGLSSGVLNPYSSLVNADQSGNVLANANAADNCVTSIDELSCDSDKVTQAYNSSLPEPYSKVSKIFPSTPGSCPSVYSSPQIFRSVGPGNNKALACGSSASGCTGQGSATVAGSEVTFNSDLPMKVGVGDALVYDCNKDGALGAGDCVAFISSRIDARHVRVLSANGSTPTASATGTAWQIYRAYTSLANAIKGSGSENPALQAIDSSVGNFEIFSSNINLITKKNQWNIALYADGADTTDVSILSSWVTGPANTLRIFTPFASSDVGSSQRHRGAFNSSYANFNAKIYTEADYITIEGLQIHSVMKGSDSGIRVQNTHGENASAVQIVGNLIFMDAGSSGQYNFGIMQNDGTVNAINNIIYDFSTPNGAAFSTNYGGGSLYNNTIYNSIWGFDNNSPQGTHIHLKNNLVQSCTRSFDTTWAPDSDYNVSSDGYSSGGSHDKTNKIATFVNSASRDLRLSKSDAVARGAGESLSADLLWSFDFDITNTQRTNPWDAGASIAY